MVLAALAILQPGAMGGAAAAAEGWEVARWGMTREDVLAAFAGEARTLGPPEKMDGLAVTVVINERPAHSLRCRITFGFDEAGRLRAVSLRPRTRPHSFAEAERAFLIFREAMRQQLAAPGSVSTYGATTEAIWESGPTVVKVRRLDRPQRPPEVSLVYVAREAE